MVVAAAGSSKGAGRPQRDLISTADKLLEEFAVSEMDTTVFYGEEWKTQKRWIERLVGDLEAKARADMYI
jgi:hypothetical protein